MERNLGIIDRVIRAGVGVLMLGMYGALPSPWRYLTLVGLVLIATAIMGRCPLYQVAGIRTCRTSEPNHG